MIHEGGDYVQFLAVQEPRFLISSTSPFSIVAANEAFSKFFLLPSCSQTGYALKALCSDFEGYSLMEELIVKAACGNECSCAFSVAQQNLPVHIRAFPALVKDVGCFVSCIATPMKICIDSPSSCEAQCILSCKTPCHLADANDNWCSLWGYTHEEVVGRSIKLLQGPGTKEQVLVDLLEASRRGLQKQCEFIAYKKNGSECAVRLQSCPVFQIGSPITHFLIQANVIQEANQITTRCSSAIDQANFCQHMAALNVLDASLSCKAAAEADDDDCNSPADKDARIFSELILALPGETHQFYFALLWRLRDQALVQGWYWEEGMLRVRADTEALAKLAGIEGSYGNIWLLRLVEAAYRLELDLLRRDAAGSDSEATAAREPLFDESATDFSFLCGECCAPPISAL
jgi:PAS domain S-box-containing protein